MGKDVLSILDLKDNLEAIIDSAIKMKAADPNQKKQVKKLPLSGKNIILLFEKPSLRTKASFAVAVHQLGGQTVYMAAEEVQMGKRESVSDIGKVLSKYFDAIVYRAFSHKVMVQLAEAASVPVINALDDLEHPCQIVGDLLTIREKKGVLRGLKLAYVGDGNNVCNSLLLGCAAVGMNISVASPSNYKPNGEIISEAEKLASNTGSKVEVGTNPFRAAENADVVYTDVWISMGQEAEKEAREKAFLPYQVTEKIMSKAKADAIFMHCMPAHRGMEVSADIIDGPRSVVIEQAENRLYGQKALLMFSFG